MKAVQELLARTDADDLILMKASQRGRRKLQNAIDIFNKEVGDKKGLARETALNSKELKSAVRSIATFIKKPQRTVNRGRADSRECAERA